MLSFVRLVCFVTALTAVLSVTPAQTLSVGENRGVGNSIAGTVRNATGGAKWSYSRVSSSTVLDLLGKFLNSEHTLASVTVGGSSDGTENRVTVKVAGFKVYSQPLSNGVGRSMPILYLNVFNATYTVVDVGVFSVKLTASAGGGAQFSAQVNGRYSPPEVNLHSAAQVYGNAEGAVKAEVLFGAASAKASATVNFLNSSLIADLPVTRTGPGNPSATLSTILWELYVKAKCEALFGWVTLASKTFVDIKGPNDSRKLF